MMEMTHLSESELLRLADAEAGHATGAEAAHLAACAVCREAVETQRLMHATLAAQPIVPVRDLSAAIRATLEAETPWLERLNWRRLTLRLAPVAAALALMAILLVETGTPQTPPASASTPAATAHTVATALFSGDVNEDQLLSLFLSARPDESLATYVQVK
jgi:hypothetical protein